MGFLNFCGLFENVFGKHSGDGGTFPEYRLLSAYDASFTPFSGRAWALRQSGPPWTHMGAERRQDTVPPYQARRGPPGNRLGRIRAYFADTPKPAYLRRHYLGSDIMENNGSGVIVTDSKNKYKPIQQKETPNPTGQSEFIRREIYGYFGVSEEIAQNRSDAEKMGAFYRGQLAQGLTNAICTEWERGFGNEILCELDRIQIETLDKRTEAPKFLTDIGALTLDQVLDIFSFAPIGGDEGARHTQTLNMVNAAIADAYQMTSAGQKAGEAYRMTDRSRPPGVSRTRRRETWKW